MNTTFSLERLSKTGIFDCILILLQYKIDLMTRFMKVRSVNIKLKQNEIAKALDYSSSILQRYRNDMNMHSPHRIQPNSNKRRNKIPSTFLDDNSNREHDLKDFN